MVTQLQSAPQGIPQSASTREMAAEAALVQAPGRLFDGSDLHELDSVFSRIPVEIDVAVPVRRFRVRNLLALVEGQVIESQWLQGEDMPLGARGTQLAWTEFEVIDENLAVRITRLV